MIDKDNVPKYARTDDGIKRIAKYIYHPEYENCHSLWFENENCGLLFSDKELPKMSKNIIDLIEVGDYVNGNYIEDIYRRPKNTELWYCDSMRSYLPSDIETIVTKEQFEKMEFKL